MDGGRVVHQKIQPATLLFDPREQRADRGIVSVVDLHRDAPAAGRVDQGGRLLDRLGPVHLRSLRSRRSSRDVDGRPGSAELHRDSASGASGRSGDERDSAGEGSLHAGDPSVGIRAVKRSQSRTHRQ